MKKPVQKESSSTNNNASTIVTKSDDFRSYYCNHVQVTMSSSDIGLICGVILPPDGGNTTVVENQFIMRLSPQTLKALASSLNATLAGWEGIFGTLNDPPPGLSSTKGIDVALKALREKVDKLGQDS